MEQTVVTRYLAVYSAVVTAAFAWLVWTGTHGGGLQVLAAQTATKEGTRDWSHADFDQLTVHRINIVEPDGTPRMILSDKGRFPGQFLKGKETARPDREDSAGMMFMNDEGTENGGLVFGGYQDKDGKLHGTSSLRLSDAAGHDRIVLHVADNGDPVIQLLDASGKVTKQLP